MMHANSLKYNISLLTKLSFLLTKTTTNLNDKLQEVVEILAEALEVKRCSLVLHNPVLERYEIVAATGINIDKDELKQIDPIKQSKIIKYVIEHKRPVVVKDEKDMITYGITPKEGYKVQSFISAPLIVPNGKFLGIINLTETLTNQPFNEIEAQTILILSDQIAITIENTRLSEEILKDTLIKEQLKIAQRVQTSLIPTDFPNNDTIESFGFTHPTFEVGGDYFDILQISEHEYAFILADVSGKGIPASLITTSFRSYWRALIKTIKSPKKILERLNNILTSDLEKEGMFLTCFYGIYNSKKRILQYGNAGHEFPLLFNSKNNEFTLLRNNDLILGMFSDTNYKTFYKKLNSGDTIFVFSDGVTDFKYLRNVDSEMLIQNIFKKNINKSIYEIVTIIKNNLMSKLDGSRHSDDLTLIGIRFKQGGE